jgi:hypothetical protein
MAFRRPRINVKPNVQATRPVSSSTRSQETTVESILTQSQEEQSTQQIEITVTPPIIKGKNRLTRFDFNIKSDHSDRNKLFYFRTNINR